MEIVRNTTYYRCFNSGDWEDVKCNQEPQHPQPHPLRITKFTNKLKLFCLNWIGWVESPRECLSWHNRMMVLFYQQPFLSCFTKSLSKAIIGKKFQWSRTPPLKAPQQSTTFKGDDDGCGNCYVLSFWYGEVKWWFEKWVLSVHCPMHGWTHLSQGDDTWRGPIRRRPWPRHLPFYLLPLTFQRPFWKTLVSKWKHSKFEQYTGAFRHLQTLLRSAHESARSQLPSLHHNRSFINIEKSNRQLTYKESTIVFLIQKLKLRIYRQ